VFGLSGPSELSYFKRITQILPKYKASNATQGEHRTHNAWFYNVGKDSSSNLQLDIDLDRDGQVKA
jgi:hypothetical protein